MMPPIITVTDPEAGIFDLLASDGEQPMLRHRYDADGRSTWVPLPIPVLLALASGLQNRPLVVAVP